MSVTVKVYVEDVATQIATYATIRLYRATSPTATFSVVATTATLVAGTEAYTLTDTAGTSASWYRTSLYNATGAVESDQSDAFQAEGGTLRNLRLETAIEAAAGFAGTCSALGTTATLIDAATRDTGIDTSFLEGAWIYRPDAAAAADMVRRVAKDGYTVATGTLTVDRVWTNAPASAEVYHIFNLLPPVDAPGVAYSWDRAVRDGLAACWFVDQLNLGEGTSTGQTRFSLVTHAAYVDRKTVRRVLLRTTDTNSIVRDVDCDKNGRYWAFVENGRDGLSIEISHPPSTDQTIIVEVNRRDFELYKDADTTACPLRLAARAAAMKAFEFLDGASRPGKYAGELDNAQRRWREEYAHHRPTAVIVGA